MFRLEYDPNQGTGPLNFDPLFEATLTELNAYDLAENTVSFQYQFVWYWLFRNVINNIYLNYLTNKVVFDRSFEGHKKSYCSVGIFSYCFFLWIDSRLILSMIETGNRC